MKFWKEIKDRIKRILEGKVRRGVNESKGRLRIIGKFKRIEKKSEKIRIVIGRVSIMEGKEIEKIEREEKKGNEGEKKIKEWKKWDEKGLERLGEGEMLEINLIVLEKESIIKKMRDRMEEIEKKEEIEIERIKKFEWERSENKEIEDFEEMKRMKKNKEN